MNRLQQIATASVAGAACAWAGLASASAGFFGSFIQIDADGTQTWYDAQAVGNDLTDFDGTGLGTFLDSQSLSISSAQGLTFKNSGSDVTGVTLNYRVTKSGDTPGSFSPLAHNFGANATFTAVNGSMFTNGGDQAWGAPKASPFQSSSPNLLTGLSAGDYDLEIFFRGTTSSDGDIFSNNGGSNYTASFSVSAVPEPNAMLLGLLGGAGMCVWFGFRRPTAEAHRG